MRYDLEEILDYVLGTHDLPYSVGQSVDRYNRKEWWPAWANFVKEISNV